MPETIADLVKQAIAVAQSAGDLPEFEVEDACIERPADTANGEWTSTVALRSARLARMAPKAIAEAIAAFLKTQGLSTEVTHRDLPLEQARWTLPPSEE